MDVGQFERDAARDHPFLAAGIDEQQILLAVVEEAEVALGIAFAGRRRCRRGDGGGRVARALDDGGARQPAGGGVPKTPGWGGGLRGGVGPPVPPRPRPSPPSPPPPP